MVNKMKHENLKPKSRADSLISLTARQRYLNLCVPLHKAALKGDWNAAEKLLNDDETLVKTGITEGGETALHVAAVEGHAHFVEKILQRMEESDVGIQNERGSTALCFAAAAGHIHIAKLMIKMNPKLPNICGDEGVTPLYMAVLQGHKNVADYLFPHSDFQSWSTGDQIELLTTSIRSGLYDLAARIVNQSEMLAVAEDSCGETPLQVLAAEPFAFRGRSRRPGFFWGNICTTVLSHMIKLKTIECECDAYILLDCLWNCVICHEDVETAQLPVNISRLVFVAAESGNDVFLVELIRRYPDFIYKVNSSKYSIFHIAVSHRHLKVFNLIYELNGVKDLIVSYTDKADNNILHLAAMLAPKHRLNKMPGAALQMQREVSWYKEVEKMVRPSQRNMKNSGGQTPHDLFMAEHESLIREGEKQIKQTAKTSMLVAVFIATIIFFGAFSINIERKQEKLLGVLSTCEAVAALASLSSMLMFLAILTSRCSSIDIWSSLPLWLVVGETALFVSILAIMVAFATSLLLYQRFSLPTLLLLSASLATVPIVFPTSKFHFFLTVLYTSQRLFTSQNRLFAQ